MDNKQRRGRVALIALVLVFTLPVLLAKLVLNQHWYQTGVSNKGELFPQYLTLEQLEQPNPYQQNKWQLVYVRPANCHQLCQQQIHLLAQSQIALGRHQDRVATVVWQTSGASAVNDDAGSGHPTVIISAPLSAQVQEGDLVIVDPLGQLVMRYQTSAQTDPMLQSKDVLADLRKLLKLSRVG